MALAASRLGAGEGKGSFNPERREDAGAASAALAVATRLTH